MILPTLQRVASNGLIFMFASLIQNWGMKFIAVVKCILTCSYCRYVEIDVLEVVGGGNYVNIEEHSMRKFCVSVLCRKR